MYEFVTVLLIGLFVALLAELIGHVRALTPATRLAVVFLAGLGLAWVLDYSMFAGWGLHFREVYMGTVGTGLVIGSIAAVWHQVLDLMSSMARHSRDQATEIESRIPRAA